MTIRWLFVYSLGSFKSIVNEVQNSSGLHKRDWDVKSQWIQMKDAKCWQSYTKTFLRKYLLYKFQTWKQANGLKKGGIGTITLNVKSSNVLLISVTST